MEMVPVRSRIVGGEVQGMVKVCWMVLVCCSWICSGSDAGTLHPLVRSRMRIIKMMIFFIDLLLIFFLGASFIGECDTFYYLLVIIKVYKYSVVFSTGDSQEEDGKPSSFTSGIIETVM
jgi:hypothetical protein